MEAQREFKDINGHGVNQRRGSHVVSQGWSDHLAGQFANLTGISSLVTNPTSNVIGTEDCHCPVKENNTKQPPSCLWQRANFPSSLLPPLRLSSFIQSATTKRRYGFSQDSLRAKHEPRQCVEYKFRVSQTDSLFYAEEYPNQLQRRLRD